MNVEPSTRRPTEGNAADQRRQPAPAPASDGDVAPTGRCVCALGVRAGRVTVRPLSTR